jgi:hypothetical protein
VTRATVERASTIRRRESMVVALTALVLGAAPTVGDIGTCGQQAVALDSRVFAAQRKSVDCQRCAECALSTQTCRRACDPRAPSNVGWPNTCYPLAEDGDVCIRALKAASCSDYASFVADAEPTAPTECDFCHLLPEAGPSYGEL